MTRLSLKTDTWITQQQIEAGEIPDLAGDTHLAAWFEWEYEWPARYADEGGQG